MDEIRNRIEAELGSVLDRLRQLGGAIVIEEFPGALGDSTPSADLMEKVQVQEDREISLVSRSLLVGRANQLAEALERLRGGKHGICEECSEPIALARLKALPEVTTCDRCQDRLERAARQLAQADAAVPKATKKRRRRLLSR